MIVFLSFIDGAIVTDEAGLTFDYLPIGVLEEVRLLAPGIPVALS